MVYEVIVLPEAEWDSEQITRYLTEELSAPGAAAALLREMNDCYDSLEQTPYMFEVCRNPQLRNRGYRRAVIGNYVMIYTVDEVQRKVYILRFFYGARDYERML